MTYDLVSTVTDPINIFFLRFPIFDVKLGHFIISDFLNMLQTHKLNNEKQKNSSLATKKVL